MSALAAQAGIAQPFLSQIETGKREGTVGTLRKLAYALKLTIDDLVGRASAMERTAMIFSSADLAALLHHYEALAARVPLAPITTAEGYDRAAAALNALMDAGAGNEAHPLAGLLALVGERVAAYEDAHDDDHELTDTELAELRPAREILSEEEFAAMTSARRPIPRY